MQNLSQSLNKPVKYIPHGYHIATDNELQIINDLYIKNIVDCKIKLNTLEK